MSVDLPAPFSPSRAWTWPQSTTRSTPSLALSPPKVLTIPWSSRAACSVVISLDLDSRLQAAVGQLLLDVGDLGLDVGRDLAVVVVVGADADAAVGGVEGQQVGRRPLLLDHVGDRGLDGRGQLLLGAGHQAAVSVRVADE